MLDDFRNNFGIAESALGFIVGVGFFTSFLGQVSIAPLADRGRAQRLIILGLGLEVIGCIGMALGETFLILLISRIIMGFGAGSALPALRRVIIVADPDNFGRNLGRILSFEVAGFASGPVISVVFAEFFGIPGPFIFLATVISLFVFAVSRIAVPETAKENHPTERFAIDLLKNRAITSGILIGVALFFMIGVFDSLWVLMMDDLDAAFCNRFIFMPIWRDVHDARRFSQQLRHRRVGTRVHRWGRFFHIISRTSQHRPTRRPRSGSAFNNFWLRP